MTRDPSVDPVEPSKFAGAGTGRRDRREPTRTSYQARPAHLRTYEDAARRSVPASGASPGTGGNGPGQRPPSPGQRPPSPGQRPPSPGQRPSSTGQRPPSVGRRPASGTVRSPASGAGRRARTPPGRTHSSGLHWPSWRTHRAAVRARKERRRARRTWPGRHPKTAAALLVVLLMTPVWVSFGEALTNPTLGLSLPARVAEWFREHGAGGFVTSIENWWYSHHPPPVGGRPAANALPKGQATAQRGGSASGTSAVGLPKPANLTPFATPRLAGEGVWKPAGRPVDGVPAVYTTFMRPDAVHTSVVDGVAWMDTKLLSATLYSGSYIPGGGPYRYTAPITPSAARTLVAAFNAGFRMQDANGGYFTQGRTIIPLRTGAASFVIYKNGSVAIGAWGSGIHMTSSVVSVRQNLDLLVQHGRPVPGLNANDTSKWGATLGGSVYVSRSAAGITKDGALVYVGGPYLNITDLANLLVRAGAVTGMELDINTDWVNFATFDPSSPSGLATVANSTDLLPLADMSGPASRYFESWWARDFFTMSARPKPLGS